jgi:hypothetical protein
MSKHQHKPVDMSVDPAQRRRHHKGRKTATPPAQLGHATSPGAARQRRDGERWLAVQARLYEDAADFTGEAAELDTDGFTGRTLQRIRDFGQ